MLQGSANKQRELKEKVSTAEDFERRDLLRRKKIKRMAYNNSERRESWI